MSKVQELLRDSTIQPNKPSQGGYKGKSAEIMNVLVSEIISQNEEFRRRFDAFEQDLKNVNGRTQLLIQEMKVLRGTVDSIDQKSRLLTEAQHSEEESSTKGE